GKIVQPSLTLNGTGSATIRTNGASANVSVVSSLTIAGGATPTAVLEMNDNDLVVKGGNAYAAVEAATKAGYNNGLWTGQGIRATPAIAAGNTGLAVESGADYNVVGSSPGTF